MKTLLILLSLLSFSAYAEESIDKQFAALNTDMRHMWSGGEWEQNGQNGFYRILVAGGGYEHYKSKIYIQWVLHGSNMKDPKILTTVGIKELNENPLYSFNLPTCIGGWQCHSIELQAVHTYELTKHVFTINFIGIGKYEFKAKAL